MCSIGSERELTACLARVRDTRVEQARLRRRIETLESRCMRLAASRGDPAELSRQETMLRAEHRRMTALLERELDQVRAVETFLQGVTPELFRTLLMLRYGECLSVPHITAFLDESGVCYSQRQVERLLAQALEQAEGLWTERQKGENAQDATA